MSRETDEPMAEPPDGDGLDPWTADAVEQTYGYRVDLDTAARHLWVLYRSAGVVGASRESAGTAPREPAEVAAGVADASGEEDGPEGPADDAPANGGPARRAARMRHAALSALTSVTILATSTAAVAASGSALPGDALYAVKRGTEQVRLVMATGTGDAQMRVELARERWTEAKRAVADRPHVVPGLVRDAVEALEAAEHGESRVADEAVSLRRQLVDESPMVTADLDDRGREDVETSMNRLVGRGSVDVAGGSAGGERTSTTQDPEPGVENRADGSSAPDEDRGAVDAGESDRAGQQPEAEDGDDADGAEEQSGEAPDGQENEAADAGPSGDDGDTTGDTAEEALGAGEVAVGDEGLAPGPADEEVASSEGEGLPIPEGRRREAADGGGADREAADGEGADQEAADGGADQESAAGRESADGRGADREAADGEADDRGATVENRGHSDEGADADAGSRSSPTLSPDPTQQQVSGSGG